jgi:hypothetical protein
VAYSGNLKTRQVEQLWVFDTVSGRDRLLLEGPAYSIGVPMISGDGLRLAVVLKARTESQLKGVGLYEFELASGRNLFPGWPPESRFPIGTHSYLFPAWTADGRLLMSIIGDGLGGKRTREHWRFDAASREFARIDGRYNEKTHKDDFKIDNRWMAMARQAWIPGRRGSAEQASSGGTFIARIDKQHRLEIQHGKTRQIAAIGSYNDCEGETLRLNGWVDGDRYLVFTLGSRAYLHDPRTGKTAPLFRSRPEGTEFFWGPPRPGLAPN